MITSLIVVMDENRGIGVGNRLPWHLSADLKRFKALTMGHHIIMGRKTYESIGKPLPGRTMVVISRNAGYHAEGCLVVVSLQAALDLAYSNGESEAFVIGGGQIFAQALDLASRIYLTRVHALFDCDTFFPKLDDSEWEITDVSTHAVDEKNDSPITFMTLHRQV